MKLPRIHKYKYTMIPTAWGSIRHSYQIVTRHGAIEFNVTEYDEDRSMKDHAPSGGLEAHYRVPPAYMEDQAPTHAKCHAIGAPCWHGGASLYASEVLIPQWRMRANEMEVFDFLLIEIDRLAPESSEVEA